MNYRYIFLCVSLLLALSCKKDEILSSEKEILSFTVDGQIGETIISSQNATVFLEVDTLTDLSSIIPQIGISQNAVISPSSGEPVDFSVGSVDYIVTAQDKSIKTWKVTIENRKNEQAEIISFKLNRQLSDAIIGDSTVYIEVRVGANLSGLSPEITVSPGATVNPGNGESVDFSEGPVNYLVTAENGSTKNWQVTVKTETIYEAEIVSYTIPQQIGETTFENTDIYLEVPVGTDVSNIIPEITISESAVIEPASGVAVDFSVTGYVHYAVIPEAGSRRSWMVYVTEEFIKPDNPYIQYIGRFDFSNPMKPRVFSSGAYINFKFSGTSCEILINDQERYGSYHNYLEIIIDQTQRYRIQTTDKINTIDIVKDLAPGEHTVTICKDTESSIGYIEFVGLRCDELLPYEDETDLKIEFIGNSITCGMENDPSQIACELGEWYDKHNAYLAYGPETARRLNAQWHLTSVSGIGLYQSCCDMGYTMPDVYDKINLYPGGNSWDFNKYIPDIVTICLGQNDGIRDSIIFCGKYVNFIQTIRMNYPDAHIVCLTSPMADLTLHNSQKNYLTGIVDHLNTMGDDKVYTLYLPYGLNGGCNSHPNLEQHQQIAGELEVYLNGILNN